MVPKSIILGLRKLLLGKGVESEFVRPFYSQCGEDILLDRILSVFDLSSPGFFIDVGAFHPFEHSNTFRLYQTGWNGINIDPNPYTKQLFDKHRPSDINLNIGIALKEGKLPYYILDEKSTMNTFSKENLMQHGLYQNVKQVMEVEIQPLSSIIQHYVPFTKSIDFLNIDAEGYEMEVLQSIDWSFKQPALIALEQNGIFGFESVISSNACSYLKRYGYLPIAMAVVTKYVATIYYWKETN